MQQALVVVPKRAESIRQLLRNGNLTQARTIVDQSLKEDPTSQLLQNLEEVVSIFERLEGSKVVADLAAGARRIFELEESEFTIPLGVRIYRVEESYPLLTIYALRLVAA